MDSIGGNRRNSGKSPPGQAPLYNQTLLANIFQRHSHYETSHFARNSAIFRIFQQCPVCACHDISGAVYLFVAGESINGPRVFNSKRAFVHDTWQCTQRRCILCNFWHRMHATRTGFQIRETFVCAYYRRALMHPSKEGAACFFYRTAYTCTSSHPPVVFLYPPNFK